MSVNDFISVVMLFFLGLGAVDFLLDGRFGIGQEFESGILSIGRLILCMAGFMALAPVLARAAAPVISPLFGAIGADPSLIAGLLLANDSGGAVLAAELAVTPDAGLFSGLIVGSMMGVTVMFNLPVTMAYAKGADRPAAIYGLLCGIMTIPLGCLVGGLAAGFSFLLVLQNTLPVLLISLLLMLGLWKLGERMVSFFALFGKGITAVSLFGLFLCALEEMGGITLLEGMTPLAEILPVLGGIALFLGGAFPALAVFRRIAQKPLSRAAERMGINDSAVTGLVIALANALPTFGQLHQMDEKGRMMNVAWIVSASCIFGDHLAYTAQVAPALCIPMMAGKAVAGLSALLLAAFLAKRLFPASAPTKK